MNGLETYFFVIPALALCLIVAISHTWFGYHIVKRGVIFADLALAQMAAFGTSIAIVNGWDDTRPVLAFALSFTLALLGAMLFALYRKAKSIVPIEALIGITYAGCMALSLLLLEKSTTGTEHVKTMLIGPIFTVSWAAIGGMTAIYALVGVLHWIFRKKLFALAEDNPSEKFTGNLFAWDFLFYATFSIVVTLSVKTMGVLPVFALLTMPTVAAFFLTVRSNLRIVIGISLGIVGSIVGLTASLAFDTAAASSLVTMLLVLGLVSAIGKIAYEMYTSRERVPKTAKAGDMPVQGAAVPRQHAASPVQSPHTAFIQTGISAAGGATVSDGQPHISHAQNIHFEKNQGVNRQTIETVRDKASAPAEIDSAAISRIAQAEADAIYAKMHAQARGIREIHDSYAEGIEKVVQASGNNPARATELLIIETLSQILKTQAELLKYSGGDKNTFSNTYAQLGKIINATVVSEALNTAVPLHPFPQTGAKEHPGHTEKMRADIVHKTGDNKNGGE